MKKLVKTTIQLCLLATFITLFTGCQSGCGSTSPADDTVTKDPTFTEAEYRAEHTRHLAPKYNEGMERLPDNCNYCNGLCIPEACMLQGNANNPQCQAEIANLHAVGQACFDAMVQCYYQQQTVPQPLTKTAAYIDSLTDVNARYYRVKFDLKDGAGGDISTHNNIDITRAEGWEREPDEVNSYSISLFRGILALPDVHTFKFYRGKTCGSGIKTLMISAYNSEGQSVYYGDLTDAYPKTSICCTEEQRKR